MSGGPDLAAARGFTTIGTVTVHRSVVPAAVPVSERRRPLLLLAGLGTPVDAWAPLRERLRGRTTLAFDAPGAGASPLPRWPLGIAALADLAVGLLDGLAVEQADVLGDSFGGAVAQELAHRHADRVGALVLASTTCGWGGTPGAGFGPGPGWPGGSLGCVADRSSETADGDSAPRWSRLEQAWAEHPPDPLGWWWQSTAIALWSSWAWLPTLTVPTLVLGGGRDRLVPTANATTLAARIPGSELVVVPDAGHGSLLADDPSVPAVVIEEFLGRQDPDGAVADST